MWFRMLYGELPTMFPRAKADEDLTVCWLRGSRSAQFWRQRDAGKATRYSIEPSTGESTEEETTARRRPQMCIVGSAQPTEKQWEAAGVGRDRAEHKILLSYLVQERIILLPDGGGAGRKWAYLKDFGAGKGDLAQRFKEQTNQGDWRL